MNEVVEFLRSLGFEPPSLTPDGKIHRFSRNGSKDSAWLIAWQNARMTTGDYYYVCIFGDWRTGELHVFKPTRVTHAESKAIEEQIRSRQKELERERVVRQVDAATKAEQRFKLAEKYGTTPYMQRKKIDELYGCCIYKDILQVPLRDVEDKIWGMQSILPDGSKYFMKGQKVPECFHTIGVPLKEAGNVYICEGFATAASIFQAVKDTVIVSFNAKNLPKVATVLKSKYPDLNYIICGDDDQFIEKNVGREDAEKAALICQTAVIFPKFKEGETEKLTDFNDVHIKYGIEELKEQLVGKPIEKLNGYRSLGYDEGTHYYYKFLTKGIEKIKTFSDTDFLNLAPLKYWESLYYGKKGVRWLDAKNDLIRQSELAGMFDSRKIRGTGVWLDSENIVINTGSTLLVNGKELPLCSLKSRYFYIQTVNGMPPVHEKPLSMVESAKLLDICMHGIKWKEEKYGALLAGWLAIARIAGALPVRPHIWLTGGKGTGKSTIMENIVSNALGSPAGKLHVLGGSSSTEAGIRQDIKADSKPIVFDEFEPTGKESQAKIAVVIDLLRQSWSQTQGSIVKGSASGHAVYYNLGFCALVSSIRVALRNDADKSRFSVLELSTPDPAAWPALRRYISEITPEFGERLFSRSCANIKKILKSYESFFKVLSIKYGARFGQQNGMLLAGTWTYLSDNPATEEEAENFVNQFNWDDEKAENRETDENDCETHLKGSRIKVLSDKGFTVEVTIGSFIMENLGDKLTLNVLKEYGMMVEQGFLFIANNHTQLAKIFKDTRWESGWTKSLERVNDAERLSKPMRFGGVVSRAVKIPLSSLDL